MEVYNTCEETLNDGEEELVVSRVAGGELLNTHEQVLCTNVIIHVVNIHDLILFR